jgi:hypothetical protein
VLEYVQTDFLFFLDKQSKFIKSSRGTTQVHRMYTKEHPTRARTMKESTKIYKAKDIENDVLTIFKTSSISFSSNAPHKKKKKGITFQTMFK